MALSVAGTFSLSTPPGICAPMKARIAPALFESTWGPLSSGLVFSLPPHAASTPLVKAARTLTLTLIRSSPCLVHVRRSRCRTSGDHYASTCDRFAQSAIALLGRASQEHLR